MNPLSYLDQVESNARTYAATFQRLFVAGKGVNVWDSTGKQYIDCLANAGTLALGHNHPEVKEAVLQFIASDSLQQALDLATPAKYAFVDRLFSLIPSQLSNIAKIQFCSPSGSDAIEAAIKLTKHYTQRSTIMSFHGAYHGMTAGALGAMGNLGPKRNISVAHGVHFLPYPYRFRCPFGTDGSTTDQLSIDYIRTVLSDGESGVQKPAALIVEVIQGEGGCIPGSKRWLQELRSLTYEYDIPLIVDEVQTGLGRTGHTFGIEFAGITPDVLVLSKAIGGGYPLAVIVYDKRLDTWPAGTHAGTFRGNQIAMVAGCTTMRIIERDGLAARTCRMGSLLMDGLNSIARRFSFLGDVRGRGLMVGVEVIVPDALGKPGAGNGVLARAIKMNCFENGLIVETGGRNSAVIRFLPPLIVSESEIGQVLDRFDQAVRRASDG